MQRCLYNTWRCASTEDGGARAASEDPGHTVFPSGVASAKCPNGLGLGAAGEGSSGGSTNPDQTEPEVTSTHVLSPAPLPPGDSRLVTKDGGFQPAFLAPSKPANHDPVTSRSK